MRTIYEALSTLMHIYALVTEKVCSCSPEEKEPYYIG